MRIRSLGFTLFAFLIVGSLFAADIYVPDPAHSNVGFSAKHLVISTVSGKFKDFNATIQFDPADPSKSSFEGTIKTASIDTGNADRDTHLKSPDFFDAEKHPEITFKSSKIEKSGDGYVATGMLTMRGVSKEIKLPFTLSGPVKDPWGNDRIGISASTTINRQDYGVSYSRKMDTGGLVVSDEIKIQIDAEATKKKS